MAVDSSNSAASDQPTCGKGLAEHAALPAKLGALITAMVDTLEAHQEAIDPTDDAGRRELHAYVTLAHEFRFIATALETTAARMVSYRDLPMARHDPEKMASPRLVASFTRFVTLEKEILALLGQAVERDAPMLDAMKG